MSYAIQTWKDCVDLGVIRVDCCTRQHYPTGVRAAVIGLLSHYLQWRATFVVVHLSHFLNCRLVAQAVCQTIQRYECRHWQLVMQALAVLLVELLMPSATHQTKALP